MNQKLKKDGNRNTGKCCNSRPGMRFQAGNMEAERRAYLTVPTFSSNIDRKEVRSMSLKLNYRQA